MSQVIQTFWPADYKSISDRFGALTVGSTGEKRPHPHRGLDFSVIEGTPLKAIGSGTIVGNYKTEVLGNVLELRCWVIVDGKPVVRIFAYCHLKNKPSFKVGTQVLGGSLIGYAGKTGSAARGAHLHLMAGKTDNLAVEPVEDPLPLIKSATVAVRISA